jgi:hypothetical protein
LKLTGAKVMRLPLFAGPAIEVGVPRPPVLVIGKVRICPEFVVAYKNWQALQTEFCIVGEPPHPARKTRIIGMSGKAKVARWVGMHMGPSSVRIATTILLQFAAPKHSLGDHVCSIS